MSIKVIAGTAVITIDIDDGDEDSLIANLTDELEDTKVHVEELMREKASLVESNRILTQENAELTRAKALLERHNSNQYTIIVDYENQLGIS